MSWNPARASRPTPMNARTQPWSSPGGRRRSGWRYILLCLAVSSAAASPGGALDAVWTKLNPAPTLRYLPQGWVNCTPQGSIPGPIGRAYSGLAYGDGKLMFFGGGHSGHPGNDVELYDIARNTWQQQYQPECLAACCCDPTCSQSNNTCPVGSDLCNPMGGTGVIESTPLGRPYVQHTFQLNAFNPVRHRYLLGLSGGTWEYDPATTRWSNFGYPGSKIPWSQDISSKGMAWDADVGVLAWITAPPGGIGYGPSVWRFDYGQGKWIQHGPMPSVVSTAWGEIYSAYDPEHHVHLVVWNGNGLGGRFFVYDARTGTPPNAGTWTEITNSVPAIIGCPVDQWVLECPNSMAYDTSKHVFVVIKRHGRNDYPPYTPAEVFTYDATNNTWRSVQTNTPVPASPLIGWWSRLHYDPPTQKSYFVVEIGTGSGGTGGINNGDTETWSLQLNGLGDALGTPGSTRTPTNTQPTSTPTSATTATLVRTQPSPTPTPAFRAPPSTPSRTATAHLGALDIPLLIAETLPMADAPSTADHTGFARTAEYVTSGIPLLDVDGVTSTSQLAVRNTATGQLVPAQFRALKTHPSGNLQWVLVDVAADVTANGTTTNLHVVRATNPARGTIATDNGSSITVDTGTAIFTIRKTNQNVLDAAVVGGTTLVTAGHAGGVIYQDPATRTIYSSNNDAASTATIEDNGPLKAVILERGRLKDTSGNASLGYSLRLTFFKNQTGVKVKQEIENAFRDSVSRKAIGYLELRVPLAVDARNFVFSTQTSTLSGTAAAGATAYLYQGTTSHKASDTGWKMPGAGYSPMVEENDWSFYGNPITGSSDNGYEIRNGITSLHTFVPTPASTPSVEYSRGFADFSDSSGRGVTVAMRDFDAYFPSGIEASDGSVAVETFSKHSTLAGWLTFDWAAHETRDIQLDFHTSPADPLLTYYRIQYPLFARVTYEQYRASGAVLGRTALSSQTEIAAYHTANVLGGVNQFASSNQSIYGLSTYQMRNQRTMRARSYDWGEGGRQTNNDLSLPKLLQFLSTGYGGQYQTTSNLVRFVADQAIWRSDRGDYSTWTGLSLPSWTTCSNGSTCCVGSSPASYMVVGGCSKFEDDMEHENVLGLWLLYYLTGDESLRDALIDHGEFLLRPAGLLPADNCDIISTGDRFVSQKAKWHSILWELTGDTRHKAQLDVVVDSWLCTTVGDLTQVWDRGQAMDRGYVYAGPEGGKCENNNADCQYQADCPNSRCVYPPRFTHVGPLEYVRGEGMYEAQRVLPASDVRKDELADRMTGYGYYVAREAYHDRSNDTCRGYGSPPGHNGKYQLETAPPESTRNTILGYDYFGLLSFVYQRTKDPVFLTPGRRMIGNFGAYQIFCDGGVQEIGQNYSYYSSWGSQAFIWLENHANNFGVVYLNDDPTTLGGLSVTSNGNGSYTLAWTVPQGAVRYQLKYGPQIMVPNLNFDRQTRTYQYSPATYDNFWAGNGDNVTDQPHNVTSEPTPAASGIQQSFTIDGLPPGQTYRFAMRVETSTDTGIPPATPARPRAPYLF